MEEQKKPTKWTSIFFLGFVIWTFFFQFSAFRYLHFGRIDERVYYIETRFFSNLFPPKTEGFVREPFLYSENDRAERKQHGYYSGNDYYSIYTLFLFSTDPPFYPAMGYSVGDYQSLVLLKCNKISGGDDISEYVAVVVKDYIDKSNLDFIYAISEGVYVHINPVYQDGVYQVTEEEDAILKNQYGLTTAEMTAGFEESYQEFMRAYQVQFVKTEVFYGIITVFQIFVIVKLVKKFR